MAKKASDEAAAPEPTPRVKGARGGPKGLSEDQITEALLATSGIVGAAAKKLGISRQALSERLEKNPAVRATVSEALEHRLDVAESAVLTAIRKSAKNAQWYLQQKGSSRGYGTKAPVEARFSNDQIAAIIVAFGGDPASLTRFSEGIASELVERAAGTVTGHDPG